MNRDSLPKATNRIDLRHTTIDQLNHVLKHINETSPEKNYSIVFITNSAFVTGQLTALFDESVDEDSKSFFHTVIEKAVTFRNEAIIEEEQQNESVRVINDSAIITLKNVTIRPFTSAVSHSVDELLLFVDSITGFTFSDSLEL